MAAGVGHGLAVGTADIVATGCTDSEPNVIHFRHAQFHVNPKFNDPALFGGTFQIAVGNDEQGTTVIEEGMLPGVHYPARSTAAKIEAGSTPSARQTCRNSTISSRRS